MDRLETVDGSNWESFVAAPAAVLVLGKSDCENCARWSEELERFLASDEEFTGVRFGKMILDRPGLVGFKKANPWLAEVDALPMNVLYAGGERKRSFPGSGTERLVSRLRRLLAEA